MCRWLAYTGEPLQPSTLVLDAQHTPGDQLLDGWQAHGQHLSRLLKGQAAPLLGHGWLLSQ